MNVKEKLEAFKKELHGFNLLDEILEELVERIFDDQDGDGDIDEVDIVLTLLEENINDLKQEKSNLKRRMTILEKRVDRLEGKED